MTESRVRGLAADFWSKEDGVTSIEYALIAALIFVVIATSVGLVGDDVEATFQLVAAAFP